MDVNKETPWGYRRGLFGELIPDETALGMQADAKNFGTSNFLGGPGGMPAYGFQKLQQAAENSAVMQGLKYGGINPAGLGNADTRHIIADEQNPQGMEFDTFFRNPALQGLKQSDPMERKRRERLANIQNIDQETNVGPSRNALYPNK